ncbi:peptidyl-alpha-hydroxyglycine alpha-amidating lyase 1-like [Adelges cooleyi]|uniref:peptidyl-alpha-hydroxyglycine alpha-amidating lyase 1-like n=1 Tax=Adelges cooleyi TaxID=133065 RepID=UPI00218072D8|nr:peptidyl-alpha-hydroxyglycine alpha-amidating lyase 1-like [Adelges cooleyi]
MYRTVLIFVYFFNNCQPGLSDPILDQNDSLYSTNKPNHDVPNEFHLHEALSWPYPRKIDGSIGHISGVSVSKDGLVHIFHRANRQWDQTTFLDNNVYSDKGQGPISSPTVVVLDPNNGTVINRWGANRFFMPHGITVDHEDNVWLTDVALHQVFKFGPITKNCSENLLMVLGVRFEPGNELNNFCKPTSVAVTTNGEFYVADGYCNSRIIKFSADGRVLLEWGRSTKVSGELIVPPYQLWIPHALTLAEDKGLICVADRENSRVLCFSIDNGTFQFEIVSTMFQRVFSVAYSPIAGGLFYIINDRNSDVISESLVEGFVVNATSLNLIGRFHPADNQFSRPHDMAASPDGKSVYVVELVPSHVWKFDLDLYFQKLFLNRITTTAPNNATDSSFNIYDLEKLSGIRDKSSRKVIVIMLLFAVVLFFSAAIFATVLIYSRTKSMIHRRDAALGRWQPRTTGVAAEGFTLGNMFNYKQRAGFEKLATVEASEDDDDDDEDNDLKVRA